MTKSSSPLTPGSSSEANTVTFTINDEVAPLSIPDDVPEFHKKPNMNKDGKKGDSDGIGPAYTIDGPKKKYHQVSRIYFASLPLLCRQNRSMDDSWPRPRPLFDF